LKKYLVIFLSVILVGAAVLLSLPQTSPFMEKPIYIAVAGPMSGTQKADGEDMVKGIQLCLDTVNDKGGIGGKKIKLAVFDDKNQPKTAISVASEIVENKDILVVLGHKYSSTSIAAGRIYKAGGIPAITATATVNALTQDNEWYFRIIQANSFQGAFIAKYVFRTLNQKTATIIFNKDVYGATLAENFEKTAREIGGEIKHKWGFDSEKDDIDKEIRKITAELRTIENPGIIFVATQAEEGVRIISALKSGGSKYSIIGPDSFYGSTFISKFKEQPEEQVQSGYYSDNIYVACPFILDVANENAHEFTHEFMRKYQKEPTWYAAGYYDAAKVAVEALKKSDPDQSFRKKRREIRDKLTNMSDSENAVSGVTGSLFFNISRDVIKPFTVGVYKNQILIPTYAQYQMTPIPRDLDMALEKVLKGDFILVDGSLMSKTDVVYTGIDINEISGLDTITSSYIVDFYLWFRYKGEIDASNILFINAVTPITPDNPIAEEKTDEYTVKTYHIKAKFKNEFDFHRHPFDHQFLSVRFRHHKLTRDKLIYVKDTLGMSESVKKKEASFNIGNGWYPSDKEVYQDIITNISTLGIPELFSNPNIISYSQFNAELKIKRKSRDAILRNIFPEMIMIVCLYLVYFIPYRHFRLRVEIMMAVLIACAFYHIRLLSDLFAVKYSTFSEYVFFTVYGLIGLSAVVSMLIFYFELRGAETKTKWVVLIGKIAYPCMIAAFGAVMAYIFF